MQSVYFIGIGGVSMSSLALILKDRGVRVAGYDFKKSDTTAMLEAHGIPVFYESKPENQDGFDTVVYTAAMRADDPEMLTAKASGAAILTRAELLGKIMHGYKCSIGVAGTHGKSTTTGMLCHIFDAAHADATVLAGATIPSLNGSYRIGRGDTAVFEACEYKDSYLAMHPTLRLVLNVELDHVDYFGTVDRVVDSFHTYMTTPSGVGGDTVLYGLDCENAVKAAGDTGVPTYTFSRENEKADFYAKAITLDGGYASFDIAVRNAPKPYCHVTLGVPGLHNVSNAVAAAGAAYLCGVNGSAVAKGLSSFTGVKRRFEKRGTTGNGALVVDDYAHHPDEIRATLAAARAVANARGGRVICLFQPHTYTRFEALMEDFAHALSEADITVMADIYAARETNIHGTSSADIRKYLPEAFYFDSFEKIADFTRQTATPRDLILTMGAGDIDKLVPLLLDR